MLWVTITRNNKHPDYLLLSSLCTRLAEIWTQDFWIWNFDLSTIKLTCKLGRLGVQNQIVDNSDSKQSEFGRRFRSDSKSSIKIVSSIKIMISFRSQLNLIKWLKNITFLSIKSSKESIKRFKSLLKDQKCGFILKESIYCINFFDKIPSLFKLFLSNLNFLIILVADLIDFVATIDLDSKNSDQKFDKHTIQIRNFSKYGSGLIASPKLTNLPLTKSRSFLFCSSPVCWSNPAQLPSQWCILT